mgnify:CR=1 FL=1
MFLPIELNEMTVIVASVTRKDFVTEIIQTMEYVKELPPSKQNNEKDEEDDDTFT